jgi:hypothetical protein
MRVLLMNLLLRYPALAWLLGAIGLVLFFVGIVHVRDFHHLEQTGIKTQGALTSMKGEPEEKADLVYAFDVAGKHYTGEASVGAQERASLHLGDKVEIRYRADDPAQNLMASTRPSIPYLFQDRQCLAPPYVSKDKGFIPSTPASLKK